VSGFNYYHGSESRFRAYRNVTEALPNTVMVMSLDDLQVLSTHTVQEFQMAEFKDHTRDYQAALSKAVQDRTAQASVGSPVILPLSAGFDSGVLVSAIVWT
jgi:asparagine synthetase B (glutamine-hydrolysing)